jgi:hypothetical protein
MTFDRLGRSACAFVAALVGFGAHAAIAGGSDPEVVLDEIFGQVEAMCGGDGQGEPYDIYAISETYFTPELAHGFETAMEGGNLGFDVLVDGQDCKIDGLALEVVDTDGDIAVGRAIFKNMGEDRIIDLRMTKLGDTWKVSDILYQHREFSLSSALADGDD